METALYGFEGRIWDLIVLVPDHCLSFYFLYEKIALFGRFRDILSPKRYHTRECDII